MQRAPYLIAAAVFVASAATAVHLSAGRDPFSQGAGVVLAIGFLLFATISTAGLLLSRGRWSRQMAMTIAVANIVTASLTSDWTPASILAVAIGAAAVIGVAGRWLDGWIRQRPTPDGPGPKVMALVLGCVGMVPAIAVAAPADVTPWHGVTAAAGLFFGWAYSRAETWALWALRIGLPILTIPALLRSPAAGAVFLAAYVGVLTSLAWAREARLAVDPLLDGLPGPRILGERS